MKLLTWNINHRTKTKAIPKDMAAAIATMEPDVVVLNEYVPGPSRAPFLAELASYGFSNQYVSDIVPIEDLKAEGLRIAPENHVLIVSKFSFKLGGITAPLIDSSVPTNFIHVILEESGLNIFGVRIPDYSRNLSMKRACLDWLVSIAEQNKNFPCILLGDFNTDPSYGVAKGGKHIKILEDQSWQRANPNEALSYLSPKGKGVCIDHAFVTHYYKIIKAQYITSMGDYVYMGKKAANGMSDHAILFLEIAKNQDLP